MNYDEYNFSCLITSIIMLVLVIFKNREVDLCIILLLAAIFSITWRSTKLIQGQNIIEKDSKVILLDDLLATGGTSGAAGN